MNPDAPHFVDFLASDMHFDNSLARTVLNWRPRPSLGGGHGEKVSDYLKRRQEAHG
jgi:nucleoside-diphosphate-sugar epimerase